MKSLSGNIARILTAFILFQLVAYSYESDRGPKWDSCHCYWGQWKAWSSCDNSCYGHRVRSREVWHDRTPECTKWEDCAKPGTGFQYLKCNEFCYNGGSKGIYGCHCRRGFNGNCCKNQVTCGKPQEITNGKVIGSNYVYASTIKYECNTDYNITIGDSSMTCNVYGAWSGITPKCSFVNMCKRKPCKNGAQCTNLIEDYKCTCLEGWSGRNCTEDIQPPVVSACHNDIRKFSSEGTLHINWTKPIFFDPLGHSIEVSTNYPRNEFSFPWGDFTVQYSAVKPFNGLSNVCAFNVSVRPYPCQDLRIPNNSAVVCSNWKTDYGRFCLQFCKNGYTLMPGINPKTLYVCGASGNFSPSNNLPPCLKTKTHSQPNAGLKTPFSSCSETDEWNDTFLKTLNTSSFNFFCTTYPKLCTPKNVIVDC